MGVCISLVRSLHTNGMYTTVEMPKLVVQYIVDVVFGCLDARGVLPEKKLPVYDF